jgi:hypothetical protein
MRTGRRTLFCRPFTKIVMNSAFLRAFAALSARESVRFRLAIRIQSLLVQKNVVSYQSAVGVKIVERRSSLWTDAVPVVANQIGVIGRPHSRRWSLAGR